MATKESKDNKKSIVEVSVHIYIFIILLSSTGGCVPLFYDHVAKNPVFGFGMGDICVVMNAKGVLYFFIVPTLIMLLLNVLNTLYSGFTLYHLMASIQAFCNKTVSKLLNFLGRMISFQSLQWAFGLIFYVSQIEAVGLVFEILVSFEGLTISSSFFIAELKSKPTNPMTT